MSELLALSSLDGRYHDRVNILRQFFSEGALIEKRIFVENKYLEFVLGIIRPDIKFELVESEKDYAEQVKEIEKVTNHDVKAVEYYLQTLYKDRHPEYIPYIHIGLTSADINSVARSIILKEATGVYLGHLKSFCKSLFNSCSNWDIPMLARTHGQFATPTNLGKEINVYLYRLKRQIGDYTLIEHRTKFGGASGGFNAMNLAYPKVDWKKELDIFTSSFGLKRNAFTTQIDNFDNYSEIFDWIKRINTILIDLCQDIWLYCSYDYFKLKINDGEVGSSTMPHKVNPIDFENAEGNLKLSNTLLSFFSEKLPVSRLQRDLTDSTVTRNIGQTYGFSYLAISSLIKGWSKLEPNIAVIEDDLNSNYAILGEAIQTILRKNGNPNGYEIVKKYTRNNKKMTRDDYLNVIKQLDLPKDDLEILENLTPRSYANCIIT